MKDLRAPAGLDNLLYSADTYFSCFADLALTSPVEYFREGQGSLMQCVITPAAPYMPWTNEAIAAETDKQVRALLLLLLQQQQAHTLVTCICGSVRVTVQHHWSMLQLHCRMLQLHRSCVNDVSLTTVVCA